MMFTGVPVSASIDPACAENASGISICDGDRAARVATTTTTGMSAATAPLTLISAVSPATEQADHGEQPPPVGAARARSAAGRPRP